MYSFQVTESAAREIARQDRGQNRWCWVMVQGGGCNGLKYVMTWSDPLQAMLGTSMLLEQHGATVYVDSRSVKFLEGVTLDFDKFKGFQFQNPKAVSSCGCGSSFGL